MYTRFTGFFKNSVNYLSRSAVRMLYKKGGFGMNELLGIAAALIIAAFVIIPGLKTLAGSVMSGLTEWWDHTIASRVFPTT